MDYNTAKHIHIGIIYLFITVFLIKVIVLFFAKRATFNKLRDKTKVAEMVLGTLLIISGILMIYVRGWDVPTWVVWKLVILSLAIPLAIIGLKRANKLLALLALIAFLYLFISGRYKPEWRISQSKESTIDYVDARLLNHGDVNISIKTADCDAMHTALKAEGATFSSPAMLSYHCRELTEKDKALLGID